ncbi:MAG: ABC transporter substrate-binding protein [Actinomycetota bacterium]
MIATHRRRRALVAGGSLILLLPACGSDAPDQGSDPTASAPSDAPTTSTDTTAPAATSTTSSPAPVVSTEDPVDSSEDGESDPVVVEHLFGTTVIESPPQRVVALDVQWTDVLLALDAPLVGVGASPLADDGLFEWQRAVFDPDIELLPVPSPLPFEAVAQLDPDLIVVTFAATSQEDYDTLAAIAPTIGPLDEAQVQDWEQLTEVAGDVFGKGAEADALIDAVGDVIDEVGSRVSGIEGLEYTLANYVPDDAIYVVADPDDGASQTFARLGLQIDADLVRLAEGTAGRIRLSFEEIAQLDANLLVMLTNGTDPSDIVGFDALPAASTGAVAVLDLPTVVGLNTPSPLSLPFSLGAIEPALEAAAAGS